MTAFRINSPATTGYGSVSIATPTIILWKESKTIQGSDISCAGVTYCAGIILWKESKTIQVSDISCAGVTYCAGIILWKESKTIQVSDISCAGVTFYSNRKLKKTNISVLVLDCVPSHYCRFKHKTTCK